MQKDLRYRVLVVLASCLLLAQYLMAAEGVNGNIVDTKWLADKTKAAEVLILDASPAQIYKAGHIPGAVNVDIFTVMSFGIREMPVSAIERVFQSLGISPGKTIVIYDQGGTWLATRLFYSLQYYGFPVNELFILDGGFFKWKQEGLPVTAELAPSPKQGSFTIGKTSEAIRARLPEFLTASGDPARNVLLDALAGDWHFGQVHPFPRAGHIPNAVLAPSEDFYNPDKTFKSPEEIRRMMSYLSIRPDQQVYAHCGGGGAAAVPYFALKFIANYPNVKLYPESQMGWQSDERELPYWTYDVPYLMRATDWLQAWGGRMMRMYGASNVTVVDVRSADAYRQGHVPYALNIAASVFRDNLASPAKLAEILGPAGVDAAHEAVVISGAGLTKDAAVAFVMLEKLGQKKVSVFMDSMDSVDILDKMSRSGFAVTKNATVVGAKKNPQDFSVAAATYPDNVRRQVIITDSASTRGAYPKVFVASGKLVPARAQDEKSVHVPYSDLLQADGTPKAAQDIWNILAKAGVPRYAELIVYSDDPGEAAVNYFVLKLMGYPDVKVLLI